MNGLGLIRLFASAGLAWACLATLPGCASPKPPAPATILISEGPHHLGDDQAKRLTPPEPDGATLTRTFTLPDASGRWGVSLKTREVTSCHTREFERGLYRDGVSLNGHDIGCLNEQTEEKHDWRDEMILPVPEGILAQGENTLVISAGGNKSDKVPNLDDFEVSSISLVPLCRVRVSVTEAGSNRSLPAKVSARGTGSTPDPRFGPSYLCAVAGYTVFAANGGAEMFVPQGRTYRLTVSHGPEYTAEVLEVQTGATDIERAASLRRVLDTTGYVACDFHLHSDPSGDSRVPLEDRVTCCAAEGLEFIVATDHNVQTDYAPAIRATGLDSWLKSAVGDEITTNLPAIGHFNAFPLLYRAEAPGNGALNANGLTPRLLLDRVGKVAALKDRVLQINHPRDGNIGYFEIFKMDPETATSKDEKFHLEFEAIEVFNGITNPAHLDLALKDWFGILNHGRFICATGNSDSHKCVLHDAGYARSWVRVPDDAEPAKVRVEDVVAAVRAGRVVVSSGPFIRATVGGKDAVGGQFSSKEAPVALEVEVQAAPWITMEYLGLIENGKPVQRVEIPATGEDVVRLRHRFELRPAADAWYVVYAEGRAYTAGAVTNPALRPRAFTNPVRVDAEGDGKFTAPLEGR